ncbi:MAG: peptidoglycan DD-metalloendopeptidase family protein [Phormidesmis sp.]
MKQAISQEAVSDPGHSCIPEGNESNASSSSLKSAAMLSIALSMGASGVLISQSEASASAPTPPETTQAFSSDSRISAATAESSQQPSSQQAAGYHTVESGESLWQIAQRHGVGLRDLKAANELRPETSIRVGQVLRVPEEAADSLSVPVASTDAAQLIAGITAEARSAELVAEDGAIASQPTTDESVSLAQGPDLQNLQASSSAASRAEAFNPEARQEVRSQSHAQSRSGVRVEPVASIAIEVAETSPNRTATAPVVTALSTTSLDNGYQVQTGDTLGSIATSLGITTEELSRKNGISNPDVILAGVTLQVPSEASVVQPTATTEPLLTKRADTAAEGNADLQQTHSMSERLAHLRSTATRPDAAKLLDELHNASPEEAISVGGEQVSEEDLISVSAASEDVSEDVQSVDPYVASLLGDVQDVRTHSVQTSEAEISEVEADSAVLAKSDEADARPSLLSERVALSDQPATNTSAEMSSAELLAAAPLSPDAYVPAQRSSTGQVVSPDMPILPEASEYLPEAPDYFNGYIWPTQGTVTSGYGWRWGRMHRGVDVAAPVGTPIVAAAHGVVEQAGWNSGGYGNLVEIRHPDGSMTRYAHNNRLNVSAGQTVRQGQQIAEMGSTGYSTGPHLHFEVHHEGGTVNPVAYLPSR